MGNKVIALASSDWHLNKWPAFNDNDRRLMMSMDQVRVMGNKCKKLGVPLLFAGDLFHKPKELSNEVITLAHRMFTKFFEKPGVHFMGISGNHDQSRKNYIDAVSPSYLDKYNEAFTNFHQIDFTHHPLNDTTDIWGIPYLHHNIGLVDMANSFKAKFTKPHNILLIHTDLHGAQDTDNRVVGTVDNIPLNMRKAFKGFDLVLSGHIHKPQKIAKNVYMLGALQQHSRKDKDCSMGYWEIYDDFTVKFKPLEIYPQFKEYERGTQKPDEFHYYDEVVTKSLEQSNVVNEVAMSSDMSRKALIKAYSQVESMTDAQLNLLTRLIQ